LPGFNAYYLIEADNGYFPGRRRHDLEVLRAFAKYVAAEK
jgi:hypothetical protein